MATNIITVGCQIPGGFGEYVSIDSQASLFDADTVLFYPTIASFSLYNLRTYLGKPSLSEDSSFRIQRAVEHWRRELLDFLNAGKNVFLVLTDLEEIYVDTGQREHSGTGRNRQTTTLVRPLSNYDVLSFVKVVEAKGSSMKLHPDNAHLREYWQSFGNESQYRVYIEKSDKVNPLVVTRDGSRVVGGFFRIKGGGTLVALPWMDFARGDFFNYREGEIQWTPEAMEWWRRYLDVLLSLDSVFGSQSQATPTPQWASDSIYATAKEAELSQRLLGIQRKVAELERTREDTEAQLTDAGWLKALLYEQGHALEGAVLKAMRLLGFEASNFRDSDSEFDAVLECPEGRCIGEVEGRDNKAIDINKMRQLIVNIQEDFSREEVTEYAKGILFGNAYRLMPPSDRPAEHFTAKCVTAAEANGIALIRTCDLFEVARALIDNPDEAYAAECRRVIFEAKGKEVGFPAAPATAKGKPRKRVRSKKTTRTALLR